MVEGTGNGEVASAIAVSLDQLFVGGLRGTVATHMVKVRRPIDTCDTRQEVIGWLVQGLTASAGRGSAAHSRKVVWLQVCGDVLYRLVCPNFCEVISVVGSAASDGCVAAWDMSTWRKLWSSGEGSPAQNAPSDATTCACLIDDHLYTGGQVLTDAYRSKLIN